MGQDANMTLLGNQSEDCCADLMLNDHTDALSSRLQGEIISHFGVGPKSCHYARVTQTLALNGYDCSKGEALCSYNGTAWTNITAPVSEYCCPYLTVGTPPDNCTTSVEKVHMLQHFCLVTDFVFEKVQAAV